MKIHIISMFPESFDSYFWSSIMKKAQEWGFLNLFFYKLNDFSVEKTKRVDDKAYGMHGQVISPIPLSLAIESIFGKVWWKIPIVYMTPSWILLTQEKTEEFLQILKDEYIILCWHYEWIDQRIIDYYVDYCVSIWEYVLSSGELSAMVFVDSLVRQIPWVLWKKDSWEEESFSQKLNRQKEYPVYTKPRMFRWMEVPEVLYSWNHQAIEDWKKKHLK